MAAPIKLRSFVNRNYFGRTLYNMSVLPKLTNSKLAFCNCNCYFLNARKVFCRSFARGNSTIYDLTSHMKAKNCTFTVSGRANVRPTGNTFVRNGHSLTCCKSFGVLNCRQIRSYCSGDDGKQLKKTQTPKLKLMDVEEIVWPSVWKTIRNQIYYKLVQIYFDNRFSVTEFAEGTKQVLLFYVCIFSV